MLVVRGQFTVATQPPTTPLRLNRLGNLADVVGMTATAPPQYSPDGVWFWTGNEWVPAALTPPAMPSGPMTDRLPVAQEDRPWGFGGTPELASAPPATALPSRWPESRLTALVPPTQVAQTNWFLRHKILTGIGAFLLMGMIGSAAGGGSSDDEANSTGSNKYEVARQKCEDAVRDAPNTSCSFDGPSVKVTVP